MRWCWSAARLAGIVGLLVASLDAAPVSGDLKVFVLNVGQGDAILIVCPQGTHRMLIDSGARGYPGSHEAFQKQLRALIPGPSPTIDVVVVTHPHEDHVGGLEWVLTNFKVKKLIDSGHPLTVSFGAATKAINKQKKAGTLKHFRGKLFPPSNVADFCTGSNLKGELLLPAGYGKAKNTNNNSVNVLVTYNTRKLLFTGDAERAEEKLLLADPVTRAKLGNISFYKIGHHGAETSTTPDFLSVIAPEMAGVSSGCKNIGVNKGYRHPRAVTLEALDQHIGGQSDVRTLQAGQPAKGKWKQVQIARGLYATPVDGAFVIVTNGTSIRKDTVGGPAAAKACAGQ
jgi:beta-lactamase superfamily II metal-dependent hydrolase